MNRNHAVFAGFVVTIEAAIFGNRLGQSRFHDRVDEVRRQRLDRLAGRAAGMRTVAVMTGMAHRGDLEPHADAILPDIGHLPEWIKTQRQSK